MIARKRTFSLILCIDDDYRATIGSFEHTDISSTSFLRTWTKMAWDYYFKFIKSSGAIGDPNPRFNEKQVFDEIENFTSPLTSVIERDGEKFVVRIFVVEDNGQYEHYK